VKVPVEDAEEKIKSTEAQAAPEAKATDELDPEEEAARVEAAKRAGEAAAAEDFKADASKVRAERDELQKQLEEAAADVEAAKKQAADASERLVRLQADWDNYRRRTAQERLDERERAAEKLVVNLLPVLDDMERASDHAAKNDADNESLMQFVDGVNAVHDKMLSVLAKEGVEVIDPVGEPFDPLIHQAVGREENKDAYDETVAQVYQKGYSMGGKVIRNAMVTVTFGGPKRPAPKAEDDSDAEGGAKDPGKAADAE
jgi:molecular chaperone GrpE